jgi:hypothetical protein
MLIESESEELADVRALKAATQARLCRNYQRITQPDGSWFVIRLPDTPCGAAPSEDELKGTAVLPVDPTSDEVLRAVLLRRKQIVSEARGTLGESAAGLSDDAVLCVLNREVWKKDSPAATAD